MKPPRSSPLTVLINEALLERRRQQPPRPYLGGSSWGEKCARKLAYEWHKVPTDDADPFSGELLRIFDMGYDAEERMASYLRLAGFTLLTETADGKQFGFSAMDGRLKGHCDGIITAGPLDLPYPIIWENKGLGKTIWRALIGEGLEEGKPVYFGQVQTYCAYLDAPNGGTLNGGLFTAIWRETGEIFDQFVPFEPVKAQALSDKAVMIVQTEKPEDAPRISNRADWWECGFCDYQKTCHKIKPLEMKLPPKAAAFPSWLTVKK